MKRKSIHIIYQSNSRNQLNNKIKKNNKNEPKDLCLKKRDFRFMREFLFSFPEITCCELETLS